MIESKGSNLGVYFCEQMDDAAEMAVKFAKNNVDRKKKEL
jgi:hypothetical protein